VAAAKWRWQLTSEQKGAPRRGPTQLAIALSTQTVKNKGWGGEGWRVLRRIGAAPGPRPAEALPREPHPPVTGLLRTYMFI